MEEFIEVSDIFVCMSGNKVVFQMDGDGRVIAFVGEEQRYFSGCVRSIVVSKLSQGKEKNSSYPVDSWNTYGDTAPGFG